MMKASCRGSSSVRDNPRRRSFCGLLHGREGSYPVLGRHMSFRKLINRSDSLFEREPDLAHLLNRSEHRGLTAVVGRAQTGKSSLLMEFARRLSHDSPHALLGPQPHLVGFTESVGETSDLMLRAVVDLYSRWLSDSSYRKQAQIVFAQQKHDLVGRAGEAFGTIFEKLSKLGGDPLEVVGGLVKETFEGLAAANRDLQSGGIQVPHLQIEQARGLLEIVQKVTNRYTILIFDQWEKSLDVQLEGKILDNFLRHVDEWPRSHIFLSLLPEGPPHEVVKKFQRAFPAAVEIYDLPPMHLDGDSGSALLRYVRDRTPAAKGVSDEELLNMISGYPETVSRWTNPENASQMNSVADLRKFADDANYYRFDEFATLLVGLSQTECRLAMRLSLLPGSKDADYWNALKPVAFEEAKPRDLDVLKRTGVLESIAPPTYGHIKRTEAALRWFQENAQEELREVCESLIFSLASRVRDLAPQEVPFFESLNGIFPLAFKLELATGTMALCQSSLSLFKVLLTRRSSYLGVGAKLESLPRSVAPLLAMGIFNTMRFGGEQEDLAWRDALLTELRHTARRYPEENALWEWLANALS